MLNLIWIFGFTLLFIATEGWTPLKALYFCWTTVTTIGFGDVYPRAEGASLIVAAMIFIGWGFTAFTIASIGALFSDIEQRSQDALLRLRSQFAEQKWIDTDFSSMLSGSSEVGTGGDALEESKSDAAARKDRMSAIGQTLQFAAVKASSKSHDRK